MSSKTRQTRMTAKARQPRPAEEAPPASIEEEEEEEEELFHEEEEEKKETKKLPLNYSWLLLKTVASDQNVAAVCSSFESACKIFAEESIAALGRDTSTNLVLVRVVAGTTDLQRVVVRAMGYDPSPKA